MEENIDIAQTCIDLSKELFGSEFKFRPYQLETIMSIVQNVTEDVKCQVMNAPTGSGKSIIGILTAELLYKIYGKKSYILVSDLSLFDQYVSDIERYNIHDIGYLKGKDSYECRINRCPIHSSVCSLSQIPISRLVNEENTSGFSCKDKCKYICDYRKAINSPITLMTYQLYFIQRNFVEDSIFGGMNPNFPKRDFVIADESHKICDIIQTHFAPVIEIKRPKWMETLDEYAKKAHKTVPDERERKSMIDKFIKCDDEDRDRLIELLEGYKYIIDEYSKVNDALRSDSQLTKDKKKFKKYLVAGNIARDCGNKIEDQLHMAKSIPKRILVKSVDKENITVNCIYENLMMYKYFHMKSGCELLMSATIGNYDTYLYMIGMKRANSTFIPIPSTFSFKNSPIYYSSKNKMSYAEKDKSIGPICEEIIKILDNHERQKGIIQTGNYENSKMLLMKLPKRLVDRLIFYDSSKTKNNALIEFKNSTDKVLVGPTLLEGLNFPGDECRFSVCMKLPYANLGNRLVCMKKDLINNWYTYDVMNKLEQGFGRGIRYDGDWCVNYILDGCIMNLMKYNRFNPQIEDRFETLKI